MKRKSKSRRKPYKRRIVEHHLCYGHPEHGIPPRTGFIHELEHQIATKFQQQLRCREMSIDFIDVLEKYFGDLDLLIRPNHELVDGAIPKGKKRAVKCCVRYNPDVKEPSIKIVTSEEMERRKNKK